MLIKVSDFREMAAQDVKRLIGNLMEATGRWISAEEQEAMGASLPRFSQALSSEPLQGLHLYFRGDGDLGLEYQLPSAGAWCDAVLLGRSKKRSSAVIFELKHWVTRGDRPGKAEGLVERSGEQCLHPSDQLRGYVEYCRRFHSAVAEHSADVVGCVLFTRDFATEPYTMEPNTKLTREYPIYTMAANDIAERLPQFLTAWLTDPDESFARAFDAGKYRQDRGFLSQIGRQILDPRSSSFELLDGQRRAFALCKATAEEILRTYESGAIRKRLIIVKGPPGSGKSAVAAKLWATFVARDGLPEGNIIFTTTSASQTTNWKALFDRTSELVIGQGIVRTANGYYPISVHRLAKLQGEHGKDVLNNLLAWKQNLELLRSFGEKFADGANDNDNLITIVDEAHALINPTTGPEARGIFGFPMALGPQAYHILRCSVMSIMFLDSEQSFRERENTTIDDLKSWAADLGIQDVVELDLAGAQFRCAGSTEYVDWVEALLRGEKASANRVRASAWHFDTNDVDGVVALRRVAQQAAPYVVTPKVGAANSPRFRTPFLFRIAEDPEEMEGALRKQLSSGKTVRLISTFSREWISANDRNPHGRPPNLRDFQIPYGRDGVTKTWSRIWNFAPSGDYTLFVQATLGSKMAADPLCEVGCPYVVRGFDYDYLGILWLEDLVWRVDKWVVNPQIVCETGLQRLRARAMRERGASGNGPATMELRRKTAQAYRILLTRALEGVYVWIADEETRRHVAASM